MLLRPDRVDASLPRPTWSHVNALTLKHGHGYFPMVPKTASRPPVSQRNREMQHPYRAATIMPQRIWYMQPCRDCPSRKPALGHHPTTILRLPQTQKLRHRIKLEPSTATDPRKRSIPTFNGIQENSSRVHLRPWLFNKTKCTTEIPPLRINTATAVLLLVLPLLLPLAERPIT